MKKTRLIFALVLIIQIITMPAWISNASAQTRDFCQGVKEDYYAGPILQIPDVLDTLKDQCETFQCNQFYKDLVTSAQNNFKAGRVTANAIKSVILPLLNSKIIAGDENTEAAIAGTKKRLANQMEAIGKRIDKWKKVKKGISCKRKYHCTLGARDTYCDINKPLPPD